MQSNTNEESQQSKKSYLIASNQEKNTNIELSEQQKKFPKPIGIYNFKSSQSDLSSLEESIDKVVSSFIEQNKENIMKYVINEVENKLNEKINPINTEIKNIKNEYKSFYEEELKDFKQLNILNECHNNIMNINDKVNIMNDNINKYNDEIKGFNISDNRLQFLNKLNKDLQEFINKINNERENGMDIDIDEETKKIDAEQKRQENVSQELDSIFYEILSLLKYVSKDNDIKGINNEIKNCDVLKNLMDAINSFEIKFDYEKPIMDEKKQNYNNKSKNNTHSNYNKNENLLDSIPDFFELNF
jgi:hypothetical protein